MERFYKLVIRFRVPIMILFVIAAIACGWCRQFILVDYDMNDYLPASSSSTVALDVMGEEFDGAIPNVRIMMPASGMKEALEYKEQIASVDGVLDVTWIDDSAVIDNMPLDMYSQDKLDTYYKDGYALFSVTVDEEKQNEVIPELYELIGDDGAMCGSAVNTAVATSTTVTEIKKIAILAVLFLLGMISTHGLLSQLGYFLGKGTICSMIAVLFVLPGYLSFAGRSIKMR